MTVTQTGFSNLPALTIDYDLMMACLEDCDASEDELKELIDCVCWIVVTFVDLGFGIESTQQALLAQNADKLPTPLPFVDLIMRSELAGEFNSKKEDNNKEMILEGLDDEF